MVQKRGCCESNVDDDVEVGWNCRWVSEVTLVVEKGDDELVGDVVYAIVAVGIDGNKGCDSCMVEIS